MSCMIRRFIFSSWEFTIQISFSNTSSRYQNLLNGSYCITLVEKLSGIGLYFFLSCILHLQFHLHSVLITTPCRWPFLTFWWMCFLLWILWWIFTRHTLVRTVKLSLTSNRFDVTIFELGLLWISSLHYPMDWCC